MDLISHSKKGRIIMNVYSASEMTRVTLADLYQQARDCYYDIWDAAKEYGRDPKIYLHWTAGHYGQFFDDYHVQIDKDGAIYMPPDTSLRDILAATWRRNSGSVAISICGCFDATTGSNLGSNPPTAAQLESLYQATTVIADALDLTIDLKHVMTHGEAGDNEDGIYPHDPYGPKSTVERWDLEYLGTSESRKYNPKDRAHRGGTIIRAKANWYRSYYGTGKLQEYFKDSQHKIKSK